MTRFLEIAPGLSIIESICGVTRSRAAPGTPATTAPPVRGELQQLAFYRFEQAPDGVPTSLALPVPPWAPGSEFSRSALWCAQH